MQKPRRCNENRKKAVHQDCPKQKDQSDPELDHILIQPVFSEPTKKTSLRGFLILWCGRWDLNPHGFTHTPLKRARLPISPLPRFFLLTALL